MNIEKTNQKGFTLIETIIYIAIIGVVVASFVNFGFSIAGSRSKTYSAQEVHANAREIMAIITDRVRSAENINVGASTFDSHPGVLSLAMADEAKNPTLIYLDNESIKMTEGLGNALDLSSNKIKISNLIFSNLTPQSKRNSVRINLTINYDAPEKTEFSYTQSLQTAVSVRK